VTDEGGKTDTQTTVAAIGQGNQPPTADAGGPYAGAAGVPLLLDGSGSGDADGSLAAAQWEFGDSETGSGLLALHAYAAPGPYTATLTVTDDDGDMDQSTATVVIGDGVSLPPTADANGPYAGVAGESVTFDGTASDDPDGGDIVQYDWEFGDGMSGTGATPDNTYVAGGLYNVILQVTDDDDRIGSDNTRALIGDLSQPPVANANGPYNGRAGVAVIFDGTASDDPDGGPIERYDWDFGDSMTGTGPTPSHTYAVPGDYVVRLTVTDESGETDTDATVATIGIGNLPPQADAGGSVSGEVGGDITFDGTGSRDLDGRITDYDWRFGDGNSGSGLTPTHVYDEPGTYLVTLTVTDDEGAPDSDATLAVVVPANQPPDCTQGEPSKDRIWPPNHKFVPVTILGVTDPDSDPVSIRIDSIFQDEPVDGRGDGHTSPDGTGVGSATAEVRAERSGRENGRVYHIGFTAEDGQGGNCTGEVMVGVPHDDRGKKSVAVDDGPNYDSTGESAGGQMRTLDAGEKRAGRKLCREMKGECGVVVRQAAIDCREACSRGDRECRRACRADKREAMAICREDGRSCIQQYR
jgi:PKD repeat protein